MKAHERRRHGHAGGIRRSARGGWNELRHLRMCGEYLDKDYNPNYILGTPNTKVSMRLTNLCFSTRLDYGDFEVFAGGMCERDGDKYLLPQEPTAEMISAGEARLESSRDFASSSQLVEEVYRTMVAAFRESASRVRLDGNEL